MSKPERVAEKAFVTKARKRWGAEIIKLQTLGPYGMTGRGDRLCVLPYGAVIVCEFKRIGKDLSKLQLYYRRQFKKLGIPVYGIYSCKEALERCEAAIEQARIHSKILSKGKRKTRDNQTSRSVLSRARTR